MYLQIVSIKCLGKSDDIVLILIVPIQEKSALDYLFSPQFPKDVEKSIRDFCKKFWNGYNFITHSFMHQTMENSNTCTYGGMGRSTINMRVQFLLNNRLKQDCVENLFSI